MLTESTVLRGSAPQPRDEQTIDSIDPDPPFSGFSIRGQEYKMTPTPQEDTHPAGGHPPRRRTPAPQDDTYPARWLQELKTAKHAMP